MYRHNFRTTALFMLLLPITWGCADTATNEQDVKTNTDTAVTHIQDTSELLDGCYLYVKDRDTIMAEVHQQGTLISGKMVFDNYQMDGSAGVLSGNYREGLMDLWYSFQAEGQSSVMQLIFKVAGDSIVRAVGEMKVNGDSVYFISPGQVKFTGTVLKRTDCDKIPRP